jgi:hypothetical protein
MTMISYRRMLIADLLRSHRLRSFRSRRWEQGSLGSVAPGCPRGTAS